MALEPRRGTERGVFILIYTSGSKDTDDQRHARTSEPAASYTREGTLDVRRTRQRQCIGGLTIGEV